MWILSCDGDLFNGKRFWLRPGSTHLLGRTSARTDHGERVQYINHKSVSRKHLVITVGEVQAGDASELHKRTEVTLKDDSKVGTFLNGVQFGKGSKTLNGKEYTIKLGSYEQFFQLVWQPVSLTCINLARKSKGDPLAAQRQQLEGTDVKLLTEYVSNETTHVVAKKRNTATGLQALVQGRRLVAYSWLDALAKATRREGADASGDPKASLLEEDFDASWPKEDEYVPPTGNEPVPRSGEYFRPNPTRAEVFQDFVFIFLSQIRYEDLLPVITSGGGKALFWEVHIGESSGDDLVSFVKEVAGKKGDSRFRLSQQTGAGGVVVVRLGEEDEWTTSFMQNVDEELEQDSIMLNEFLDAVLMADANGLRRPVLRTERVGQEDDVPGPNDDVPDPASRPRSASGQDEAMEDVAEQPSPAAQVANSVQEANEDQPPEQPPEQPTEVKKRWNRRAITKSRFQGFEEFDTSQFTRAPSASPEPSLREPSQAPSVQATDVDPPLPAHTQQSTRKRPAPTQEEEDKEEMYENLLQGQAALKRRKTEAARKGENNSFAKSFTNADRIATEKAAKSKRKEKQFDVKTALAERKAAEEERRRKDGEALREQLDGVNIDDLKNLAQVEEMEIPVRERPARSSEPNAPSDRWDPAWDGRKNFKKFRPQGQRRDGPRPRQVIVQLEEVPRKGHGIGDEYWLNSGTATSSGRSKSKSQPHSQSIRQGPSQSTAADGDGEALRFQRRLQRSREEDAKNAASAAVDAEAIAGTARDEGLRALVEQSQTLGTESQRRAAGKRRAAGVMGGGPPVKKARQIQTRLPAEGGGWGAGDEDEDDGLKFKRRRRV